ncbi:MAG TPA: phage recombination protein Bet, partial [Vicinamibacterales bacterium]|nr:phage recombination protein Bet [Vicinamibacterales bacterium]
VALPTETRLTNAQMSTLRNSLFPGASDQSIAMVVDYCTARGLDPMKKPCHIVPISVKVGDRYEWRDVVMPGIYELRTTAMRTGLYVGQEAPVYGDVREYSVTTAKDSPKLQAPESVTIKVRRLHRETGTVGEFVGIARFTECVGTNKDGSINARWQRAPFQMLEKCAEAAALRRAFPDELGGEHASEEMEGITIEQPREISMPQSKAEGGAKISDAQHRLLRKAIREASGGGENEAKLAGAFKEKYGLEHSNDLLATDFDDALTFINDQAQDSQSA